MMLEADDLPEKGMQRGREWRLQLPWSKDAWDSNAQDDFRLFFNRISWTFPDGEGSLGDYKPLGLLIPTAFPQDLPPFPIYIPSKQSDGSYGFVASV
jgi:hypothetical protein